MYVSLEEKYSSSIENHPDNWDKCPICENKPKVWVFDNGRYAKCDCYELYGKFDQNGEKIVSAVSVGDWARKKRDFLKYPFTELRDNWNKRCNRLNIFNLRNESIDDLLRENEL